MQNSFSSSPARLAQLLLQIGAVRLQPGSPFTWSSGWRSPIYCDNRLTLSYPEIRTFIKEELAALIRREFPGTEAIAGVATAGIPQGALVADALGLPFLYVRSEAKKHGMTNLIEGRIVAGQKTVILEDLVSTGGSSLKVVDALREAGMEVLGMAAIFTYGFAAADQHFAEKDVTLRTLSDYNSLIQEAVKGNSVAESDLASLQEWRQSPDTWG